ncbi:cell division protein SepF [Bifidobacterium sp. ESL0763]|uniref:cell division protein SepF n=1 Tax=Bifidobacterium sp. ESL0763 TaxID=2983227 RepID=UPI0023F65C80|nr:cell division protein SepF [Bifidobacterium sp. ESL0763]MDF7664186.1 cell division protein SepF [Bifidobacterium sp. ESL0763]
MAGYMKKAMSYLGMTDVVDDDEDDEMIDDEPDSTDFDSDATVTPVLQQSPAPAQSAPSHGSHTFPAGRLSRIATICPKSYDEAQKVGRAVRDGIPVVLNLTGLAESVAYRIVDFSAGVVFGVRGSIERVTPRVFLLSPSQVKIKVEDTKDPDADLF